MNHEQAFLKAINENPLDLVNYWIYSDWLLDQKREDEAKRQRNRIKFISRMWHEVQERKYLRKFPCLPLPCQWTIDEAKKKLKVPMQVCWNRLDLVPIERPYYNMNCDHFESLTKLIPIESSYSIVELIGTVYPFRRNYYPLDVINNYIYVGQCSECLAIYFGEHGLNIKPVREFK